LIKRYSPHPKNPSFKKQLSKEVCDKKKEEKRGSFEGELGMN